MNSLMKAFIFILIAMIAIKIFSVASSILFWLFLIFAIAIFLSVLTDG